MNPPIPVRPFNPPPRLVDNRVESRPYIPATVTRGFPIDRQRLAAIEQVWGPARAELAAKLEKGGEYLENKLWDWVNKVYHPAGKHCLVVVECEGQVQGIMAAETKLRPSVLTPGVWVVYVDLLESAPWNYRIPLDRDRPAVRTPRFAGVGALLVAEAVRMSFGRTANGRVGLHALNQAADFYDGRCGMTRVGKGHGYDHLYYFEYPEGKAASWLTDLGFSE